MTSNTTALLQNLATLRATRAAILAELESISTAILAADTGDVAPWVNEEGGRVPWGGGGKGLAEDNGRWEAPALSPFDDEGNRAGICPRQNKRNIL